MPDYFTAFRGAKFKPPLEIEEVEQGVPSFETPAQAKSMELANGPTNKLLSKFIESLNIENRKLALEVAAGHAHVTRDILLHKFDKVHSFDKNAFSY